MDTPFSLLDRLRKPTSEEAWTRFVDLYTPLLYHWARRAGCSDDDAADLVQEVFVHLLRKLSLYRPEAGSFRAWLRAVAVNRWHNLQRRKSLPLAPDSPAPDSLPGPEVTAQFEEAEYRRHLSGRALALMQKQFKPTTWKACWAVVVEGRPAAEVAAELGLGVGAVYMARSRVLARLREELAGLLD